MQKPQPDIVGVSTLSIPGTMRSGAILARKRVARTQSLRGFSPGHIFDIYGWKQICGVWYCITKDPSTNLWHYIAECLFDWSKPDFEVEVADVKAERESANA